MDRHRPRRAGFTLVEILIVIVIIGILMALILPAITAAFRRAKEAQVTAELNNLATALASFKNAFGDYPPSRIVLCEGGMANIPAAFLTGTVPTLDTNDTDMTGQQLVNRSLIYLRKFWPRCDFVNAPPMNPSTGLPVIGHFNDFNGNGSYDGATVFVLTGSECLSFFLGGVPIPDTSSPPHILGLSGFSKSPVYPFVAPTTALNRTVSNYEFNNGRLVDLDGNTFPSYIDPFATGPTDQIAYAYFSSYGVNGYDPNDNNCNNTNCSNLSPEMDDQATPQDVERAFTVNFPTSSGTTPYTATSPAPNPYTSGPEIFGTGATFINPNTFQLFSAGPDHLWGLGGQYVSTAGTGGRLPMNAGGNTHNEPAGIRLRESDNITNFSSGRLD